MRVIVCGSREFSEVQAVRARLSALLNEHGPLTVVHGACPRGADAIADLWAAERIAAGDPVEVVRCPADWGRHGRKAGPVRNQQMVDAGADLVLAYFQRGAENHGTADCVRRAQAARIPVRRYPPVDGAEL